VVFDRKQGMGLKKKEDAWGGKGIWYAVMNKAKSGCKKSNNYE